MEKKKMKLTTKLVIGGIAVVAVLVVVIALLSMKPTINLNRYLKIEFEGYDTVGTASASLDYDQIMEDYAGKLKADGDLESLGFGLALYAVASGELDQKAGLSNGDTVTFEWTVENQKEFEEKYGCKLCYKSIKETVSGLESAKIYDPFADLEVTFSGISSVGTAAVSWKNPTVKGLSYSLSPESGLSNGDEVKLVISAPYGKDLEEYCRSYGCIPGATEKTYVVSGLEEAEEFDPFEDIEVTFSGYSSIGKANIEVLETALSGLNYTVEPSTGLRNGDEVKVTVSARWGEDVKDYCISQAYIPTATEKTYTVSGLEEAEEFDPFEQIEVVYTGIDPNGKASVALKDAVLDGLNYSIDKSSNLSNGMEIVITVVSGPWGQDLEEYCIERGYVLSKTEKTYKVEGLSRYVTALDEVDQDTLDKMDEQAKDAFYAYCAKNWAESESLQSVELLGNYFLTVKDTEAYSSNKNYLYFVYEVEVANSEGNFTYYYYTSYSNIMELEDGTLSFDLSNYDTPFDSFLKGSYRYYGYEKLDTLFNKCVTAKMDAYRYESNLDE